MGGTAAAVAKVAYLTAALVVMIYPYQVWCHAMLFNAELGKRVAEQQEDHLPSEIRDVMLRACIRAFFDKGLDVLGYPGHQGSDDPRTGRGPQLQSDTMEFRFYVRPAREPTMSENGQRSTANGNMAEQAVGSSADDEDTPRLTEAGLRAGTAGAGEGGGWMLTMMSTLVVEVSRAMIVTTDNFCC